MTGTVPASGAAVTAAYLHFHAARAPQSVAIIDDGRPITYERLVRDLSAMRQELATLGLRAGDLAAVQCRNMTLHWVILLALEELGIVTTSISAAEGEDLLALYPLMMIVLTDSTEPVPGARRIHAITEEWAARALADPSTDLPPHLPCPAAPQAPIRLVRTSGTTGSRKNLLRTRAMQDARYRLAFLHKDCCRAARYLFVPGFSVESVYCTATAVLRAGGTAIFESGMTILDALAHWQPTGLDLLPVFLERMLQRLPADFRRLPELTIYSTGGFVPAETRDRVVARIAGRLEDSYGTNEVGPIGFTGPDRTVTLLPEVSVEIVDARGDPVPFGSEGSIRVRSPVMAEGYLGDAEASSRLFRDGWFYPGDFGSMQEAGRLRLLGRRDEILNIGGLKFAPQEAERKLATLPMIRDVAVTSRRGKGAMAELCLLVVADVPEAEDLAAIVSPLFPLAWTIRIWHVDRIPRTPTGKIERHRLRELVEMPARSRDV